MKINDLERLCRKNKDYSYEYYISEDNRHIFVNLKIGECTIFPDEDKKIRSFLKRNKWKLQYIYYSGSEMVYAITRNH